MREVDQFLPERDGTDVNVRFLDEERNLPRYKEIARIEVYYLHPR